MNLVHDSAYRRDRHVDFACGASKLTLVRVPAVADYGVMLAPLKLGGASLEMRTAMGALVELPACSASGI